MSTGTPRGGLSPRVRGNLQTRCGYGRRPGSIPACAGEPSAIRVRRQARRGLSPRVRGNQRRKCVQPIRHGSIPACAGEPQAGAGPSLAPAVYPRVCGGTRARAMTQLQWTGLSPRVRGNPRTAGHANLCPRSIPACAGEPGRSACCLVCGGVYPRVCGGTVGIYHGKQRGKGLSPRVRGNLGVQVAGVRAQGSIPACAGEPFLVSSKTSRNSVYPRVCGGTSPESSCRSSVTGLSPRVRGNPITTRRAIRWLRSIPACAGEPGSGS